MPRVHLHLFGTFRATLDGEPLTGFRSDKARGLLAYLHLQSGKPILRDTLATLFWEDFAQTEARTSLRQVLSNLRQMFETVPLLDITRQDVTLSPAQLWADVLEFDRTRAGCPTHAPTPRPTCPACLTHLAEAATHYTGDFLAGFSLPDSYAFDEWRLLQQETRHQQCLTLLRTLADSHAARGEFARAESYARQQLTLAPWHEDAHRALMRALAGGGQRAEALSQYQVCRRLLADELGVEPDLETTALYESIRDGRFTAKIPAPAHNLPTPGTSFIGRETEITHLDTHLADPATRLITITGEGGVGKTRLALAVAAHGLGRFPDGVWFVPLAGVSGQTPNAFVQALAAALNIPLEGKTHEPVLDFLRQKNLLLVLDNLEHLLEGDAPPLTFIQTLLQTAPRVQCLITSRERLNLQAEHVLRLSGLPVPAEGEPAPSTFASAQLFAERAARAFPGFALTPDVLPHVVEICRLVEGSPLGIELAASWVEQFTCQEIARAIAANLDFLSTRLRDLPARHRSLRAAFEYSWQLLPPAEQRALVHCTLFASTFSREAILAVTDAHFPDLLALVDKSLLRVVAPGRYSLHSLIRQFAAEKFPDDAAQRRYATYYADFVCQREARLKSKAQLPALRELDAEIPNIRRAWTWVIAHEHPLLPNFTTSLGTYYHDRGLYGEGLAVFQNALRHLPAPAQMTRLEQVNLALWLAHFQYRLDQFANARALLEALRPFLEQVAAPVELGRCLFLLGAIAAVIGDKHEGLALFQRAIATYRAAGYEAGVAEVLNRMGTAYELMGKYAEARQALEESVRIKQALAPPPSVAHSMNNLALLLWRLGENERAEHLLREALSLQCEIGNEAAAASSLSNLALVITSQKDYPTARALFLEALAIQEKLGNRGFIAILYNNLGDVANLTGDHAAAKQYLEASLRIKTEMNNSRGIVFSLVHLGHAHFGLGDYPAAWQNQTEAIRRAQALNLTPLILAALVGVAQLLDVRGDSIRALEVIQLPLHHPAAWERVREEAGEVEAGLVAQLPRETGMQAQERGKGLDLAEQMTRLF